jgi:hypothetical protein
MAAPVLTATPAQMNYDGPGIILMSPLASTLPTFASTASIFSNTWDAAWIPVGYTDTGFQLDYTLTTVDIDVAESLRPVDVVATKDEVHVKFTMLQTNKFNIKAAFNGGTWTVTGATTTQVSKYSPPLLGANQSFMLGWLSQARDEAVLVYKVFQSGSLSIQRAKAGTKALLACDFRAVQPDPLVSADQWNWYIAGTASD